MITTIVVSLFALFVMGAVTSCGALLAHRFLRCGPTAAVLVGIALTGVTGSAVFFLTVVEPTAGTVFAVAAMSASLAGLLLLRAWHHVRIALPGVVAVLGILAFDVGMLYLRRVATNGFDQAAERYASFTLPVDNRIPSLLATYAADEREDEFLIGDWLPSDRPPLQSGLIILVRAAAPLLRLLPGLPPTVDEVDFGASVAAQLLWIPAALCLLASLGFRSRTRMASVLLTAVVPVMFVNTTFTWPKVLAGAMTVASIAMLMLLLRHRGRAMIGLPLAAVLACLGLLSHGATAFAIPFILAAAGVILFRESGRGRWLTALVATASTVLCYLPWMLFQRSHAPGDRLLKWHLAGVVPVDDRTFGQALLDSYGSLTWQQYLSDRAANLGRAFDPLLLRGLDLWNPDWYTRRLKAEFFNTPESLGTGAFVVLALLLVAFLGRVRGDPSTRRSAWLAVGMLGCIGIWTVLMFSPGSAVVHQGSHTWTLVLLCVGFAWLSHRSRGAIAAVAVVQLAWTGLLYQKAPLHPESLLDLRSALVAAFGVALMLAALALSRRSFGRRLVFRTSHVAA